MLKGGAYATLGEAEKAGAVTVNYGVFINTLINFLIIAFVLFIAVRQINRMKAAPPPAVPAAPPEETILLREIRDLLKEKK